ncbi:hypothetical protein FNF29_07411 [Cafeteria roenbergensis]|uniref:TNFR-Cys domain-containing protein n=1 Tax=Cafeteria roenbergensis TaxID=33653 RepID=A0A5A8C2Y1_CAFRO|nr:hypothetical protein FNF29_07411 [Cafeteria roenbergensis]|eukprot:KAA0147343.1 hypothetical protein FNF29_07411 [Cafeteria roenbergensis]
MRPLSVLSGAAALAALIGSRVTAAVGPATVCVETHDVPYDCNCADCNCETCYSCSCTAAVFSCDHTSCGSSGCWCSPLCKCCHIASCEYPCNCKSCCETCHRQECKRSVTYSATAVRPATAEVGSAGDFTVAGYEFADTNNVTAGGVIQWREAPGGMARDAGTLELVLVRDGSSLGEATAVWRCIDGSAKQGRDFSCGGGQPQAVSWADGDSSPKTVSVELLAPPSGAAGQDAGEVAFDVVIGGVAPEGVSIGSRANVTVLLWPPSMDRLARENVRVTFRLLAAYSAVTRAGSDPAAARFREQLVADLAGEDVLHVPAARLLVSSVGSALSGRATVCTLLVLRPATATGRVLASPDRADAAAGVVATAFVELASNTSSAMYAPQRTWSRLTDVSFAPVVEAAAVTPSPQPAPGQPASTPPWAVAVGVAVPVLVAAIACLVGYRNRRAIAEWLLWRAGQLRFASLQDTDHRRQLELELEEFSDAESAGEGGAGALASPAARATTPRKGGGAAAGEASPSEPAAASEGGGDTVPLAAAGAGGTQRWGPVVG